MGVVLLCFTWVGSCYVQFGLDLSLLVWFRCWFVFGFTDGFSGVGFEMRLRFHQ